MRRLLPVLLINPQKLQSPRYIAGLALIFILFVVIAMRMGNSLQLQADFTVFWQAGKNFNADLGLYERIGGAERFIYPPVAAMFFQFFALFSLQTAGAIWAFINLLMWLTTVYVLREILRFTSIPEKRMQQALMLGAALSFRYFWYHLMFMQMNLVVLLLSLTGLLLFLKKQNTPALVCLIVATGIKVIPIVFLGWLLSKTHPKVWLQAFGISVLIFMLPLIWRGWEMGVQDLNDYYNSFLEPFQNGRVEPKLQNYALAAAVYKWFVPLTVSSPYFAPIVVLSAAAAGVIYKVLFIALMLLFVAVLAFSRFRVKHTSLHEVAFVLLFTHLISGITWEYHLVSLLVVYVVYFSMDRTAVSGLGKVFFYALVVLMVFNAIVGMDTVGKYFYYISCGYSFLTVLMLLLLLDSAWRIFHPGKQSQLLFRTTNL